MSPRGDARAATVPSANDAYRRQRTAIYGAFFAIGIGTLCPWNVFITERAYFARRFTSGDAPARAYVGNNFEGMFANAYAGANLLGLLLCARVMDATRARAGRLAVPLGVVGCAVGTSAMVACASTMSGDAVFVHTIVVIIVVGFASALAQGGGFAVASYLPPTYAQATMSGQAASGVAVSLVAMMTTAGANGASNVQAVVYFSIAACVLFACAWATWYVETIPLYQKLLTESSSSATSTSTRGLLNGDANDDEDIDEGGEDIELNPWSEDDEDVRALASSTADVGECTKYRLAVLLTFTVTLSVFPAVTSAIQSAHNLFGNLWSPMLFLLFNVGDLIGRHCATVYPKTPPRGDALLRLALARCVFAPLLASCDVSTTTTTNTWRIPRLFTNEFWPILFILALAITNGWIASLGMMHGPSRASLDRRPREGVALAIALVAGIFIGSSLSVLLVTACTSSSS